MTRPVRAALAASLLLLPLPPLHAQQLATPGISLELARHRAATLSDIRYDLRFRIPVRRDAPITGVAGIRLTKSDDGPLILDFARPVGRVGRVRVDGELRDVELRAGHVVIPGVASGERAVEVEFVAGDGPLNRRDEFLYTLFVPDRAHEAFPSFDQPDLKARFRLELLIPAAWTAVANGEVLERAAAGRRMARVRFAETEPIPTYLVSFAAGRFRVEEAVREGRRMRMLHRETDAEKVARNRDAIFDLHATALAWLEEYTGIPYPFGKFDFVAVPSFQYGGMEHPGAILYRASSLFLDESATRNQELGRASLIAHETAHMWFGDLVTMRWFDDVWMKEVFANFMAAKIVNPSFPEIDHDLRFLLAHYPAAYSVDRTLGANPIRQELDNLDDAGSLYGAIIYQKAPIVMRQLELLTGEAAFRTALRAYLSTHAFGNATWPDLVAELDAVTAMDVPAWSRVWVEEPGRPTLRWQRTDGGAVLIQEDPRGRGLVWEQQVVPVTLFADEGTDSVVTVTSDPVRLATGETPLPRVEAPGAGFVARATLPNGAGLGYGLVVPSAATVDRLLSDLHHEWDDLARAAGWITLRELMLEDAIEPAALLAAGRRLVLTDQDELLVQEVLGDLVGTYWRYLAEADTPDGPDLESRRAWGERLERALWARMGAVESSSLKAAYFNAWRSLATSPEAVARMESIWRGTDSVPGLPLSESDRTTLALQLAVREVDGWERILDEQAAAIDNADRRARFDYIRPAVHADPAVRDSFFASLAELENRSREAWVLAAVSYLHHPLRTAGSVRYIRPSLELLREIKDTGDIFFPKRWLDATLGNHHSAEAAAIVAAFIDGLPADYPPRLLGKLLQSADALYRSVGLRPRPDGGP